ncbi:MAG: FG-GAP-like repeat-containing protein, partial [Rhodothermales bacterium]
MRRASLRSFIAAGTFLVIAISACRSDEVDTTSDEYRDAVAAFYIGVAAMQVGQDLRAEEQLQRVVELTPEEPASWANLGILALRRNELDLAGERLERARELAPADSRIEQLLGRLASTRGDTDDAIVHYRRSLELDPNNVEAAFALAEELEQRGGGEAGEEVRRLFNTILEIDPDNLAILVEKARLAAIAGDRGELDAALDRMEIHADEWSDESRLQLSAVRAAAEDPKEAAIQVSFLNNVLKREPQFRESIAMVRTEPGQPGELFTSFISLPTPESQAAAPDDSLSFAVEPLFQNVTNDAWRWARAVALSAEGLPVVVAAAGDQIFFEDGTILDAPSGVDAGGLIPIDYNYDFRVDLALAGSGGFRLYRQDADSSFVDVTRSAEIPEALATGQYGGGWTLDYDMEGDLDLVLAPAEGPAVVLRNDGDGTFSQVSLFQEALAPTHLVWADLDSDGDPDAGLLDSSGRVHIYENRRSRGFEHREGPEGQSALAVADIDTDGVFDLNLLQDGGAVERYDVESGNSEVIASWDAPPQDLRRSRLFAADVDNNGRIDLVASGGGETAVWLSHPGGPFTRLAAPSRADAYTLSDVSGGGRLDIVGLDQNLTPVRLANRGTRIYHSKSIRPQAAEATGDQRINPFGLGGEIEVRAGVLFQKQIVSDPIVHFGLGDQLVVDVVRIVWPNGDVQAEFDLLSDETVQARQRLKGSCPWLFAFDGKEMRFVTDFLWRSPLGLRINAQETAGIATTEDWVKIDGSELRSRDGFYDLRITAELWETHFFDHVSLLAVDHPEGSEIFVDERFGFPPPEMKVHATGPLHPVRAVFDDSGENVTSFVIEKDQKYLAAFSRGQYQGIAEDHGIIVHLDAPKPDMPLLLVAEGWIRPTDSSINVA